MLRGERRFPSALLRARERVGRPFTCLRYRVDRPFRHVRKGADHAKYSKNKKTSRLLLSVPHDGCDLVNATRECDTSLFTV